MKRGYIILEYKDKVYQSKISDLTEKEFEQLEELVAKVVSGQADFLSFKIDDDKKMFFGKEIIKNSIIILNFWDKK